MTVQRRGFGSGNIVVALYAVFALSATVRASYQIFRKFEEAPLAYSLSLLAGLVYILATVALVRRKFWLARLTLYFELVGVVIVGALSIALPGIFSHPTVWSNFGISYGFIPLVLPIFGLWWLRRAKK